MKKIGLIGGISWVSTADYYRYINVMVNERLGGLNFAECIIYSFNYAEIKKNNDANDWERTFSMISSASEHLRASGAEAIVLCANTMHMIADRLQAEIGIPVIHIADATAETIHRHGQNKVGLLGTKFTMQQDFFRSRLTRKGIEVIVPGEEDMEFIHHTIFEELGRNVLRQDTKKRYLAVIEKMITQGAQGVVLGCTEIPLLIHQKDINITAYDTTLIHSVAAVDFMLS